VHLGDLTSLSSLWKPVDNQHSIVANWLTLDTKMQCCVLLYNLKPRLGGDEMQSSQMGKDDDKGFSEGFLSID